MAAELTRLAATLERMPSTAARDEPHLALAALRRPYHPVYGVPYLSTFLREEGRLAAQIGDRTGAIRAYGTIWLSGRSRSRHSREKLGGYARS